MFIAGVDLGAVVEEQRQSVPTVKRLCRQVKRSHATLVSGVDTGSSADQKRHTPRMPGCGMQSGSAVFVTCKNVGAAIYERPELYRPKNRCRAEKGSHATVVAGVDIGASVEE